MNTTTTLSNTGCWPRLTEGEKQSVLDVLSDKRTCMCIRDCVSAASTCSQWEKAFSNFLPKLKTLHVITTPFLQRFVLSVQQIDRTDNPKFKVVAVGDDREIHFQDILMSQRAYEMEELYKATEGSRKAIEMSDAARQNLLDEVNNINPLHLTLATDDLPICKLMKLQFKIKKQCPNLELLLQNDILMHPRISVIGLRTFRAFFGALLMLVLPPVFALLIYSTVPTSMRGS